MADREFKIAQTVRVRATAGGIPIYGAFVKTDEGKIIVMLEPGKCIVVEPDRVDPAPWRALPADVTNAATCKAIME
jgi:hypothetical protein